jgi:hypothetical protein
MSRTWQEHDNNMATAWQEHGTPHALAMNLLSGSALAMFLPWSCHVIALILP